MRRLILGLVLAVALLLSVLGLEYFHPRLHFQNTTVHVIAGRLVFVHDFLRPINWAPAPPPIDTLMRRPEGDADLRQINAVFQAWTQQAMQWRNTLRPPVEYKFLGFAYRARTPTQTTGPIPGGSYRGVVITVHREYTDRRTVMLTVPEWVPAVLAALLITWGGWSQLCGFRRRRLIRKGICPECGYDLRATPERCPECGFVVSDPPRPGTGPSGPGSPRVPGTPGTGRSGG